MNKQNGSALIISLLMLLVLTMLGITSMSTSTLEEKMAANDRNQKVVFQTSEIALVDSEAEVINADFKDIENQIIATNQTIAYYDNATWVAGGGCKVVSANNCYLVQQIDKTAPLENNPYGQPSDSTKTEYKLNITARSTDANNITTAMVQSSINKVIP